jgi:PAS domain S-box-containing protein
MAEGEPLTEQGEDPAERLRLLEIALAASQLGTFRWDVTRDQVTWDSNLRRVFGVGPEAQVRCIADFLAFVHPDDRALVVGTVQRALADGTDPHMDFRIRRPDGSVRWIADRARIVAGPSGPVLIGACMDVTDRKEVEQRLRESEERYRALVETSPDGVYVHWGGQIRLANRRAAALLGAATPDLLVGRDPFAIVHPESIEPVRARVARLDQPGARNEPAALSFQRLDGKKVDVEVASAAVFVDGQLAVQVTLRDLAEREASIDAVRDRDEILALIERSAGIGIWDIDLRSGLVRGTGQYFRLYGLPPTTDAVPLETFRRLQHPADRERVSESLARAAAGTDSCKNEYRILLPDGSQRWLMSRGRIVRDVHRSAVRCTGIDLDITERRTAEDRQALLLAELSHRVKNTLAVVQSIAGQSLTADRPAGEARAAFMDRVQRLTRTHELLTASDWRGASLRAVAEGELGPYAGRASVSGPDLRLTPKASLLMALVLHELATNAAKHGALSTPGGRVEVGWSCAADENFRLWWREREGPPVEPASRRSFGRLLIERAVAYDLRGSACLELAVEGVRYELTAPAAEMLAI